MGNFFDKYELYTEGDSIYCYPGTSVLKNKLNIKEPNELKKAETDFVSTRMFDLELNPIKGDFDPKHLYAVHQYMFQDVYDFAGQTRKEDISKGSTKFCVSIYIDDQLTELFQKIKKTFYKSESREEKINFLAFLLAELNIIHPFREGNGRAIREFLREYAQTLNLRIHWDRIEKESLMDAMILSVANTTELKKCMNNIIESFGEPIVYDNLSDEDFNSMMDQSMEQYDAGQCKPVQDLEKFRK